jgi:GT2 family glycosyltransferase
VQEEYTDWRSSRRAAREKLSFSHSGSSWNQFFTIILFGCDDNGAGQSRTLKSLLAQTFRNIEIIVAGKAASVEDCIDDFRTLRGIFVEPGLDALGLLSVADHDTLWRGGYLTFARAGTEFDPDCFALVNDALNSRGGSIPELVVMDHDRFSPETQLREPVFLPGWDPDLVQALDCIGTAFVVSRGLVESQRASERPRSFHDWLKGVAQLHPQPRTAHVSEPVVQLPDPPPRLESPAQSVALPWASCPREERPSIAIVIPNRNRPDLLRRCLGFLAFSNQFTPELVIVDNGSDNLETLKIYADIERQHGARIVSMNQSFNYARMVNLGVSASRADVVVLMNNDIEFTKPNQIEALVRQALRPEVGVAGSLLLYEDGSVQHAGIVLSADASERSLHSHHVLRGASEEVRGCLFPQRTIRNYQAVTGALQAIRRDVFVSLGGYDELHLPVEYNDVDFCLRARKAGLRVISVPLEGVIHRESSSRRDAPSDAVIKMRDDAMGIMTARWPEVAKNDPFVNPWVEMRDRAEPGFPWDVKREAK